MVVEASVSVARSDLWVTGMGTDVHRCGFQWATLDQVKSSYIGMWKCQNLEIY